MTAVGLVAGLGGYLGSGGSMFGVSPAEASAAVAHAVGLPDPSALLGMRSPGARDGAALRNTKHAHVRPGVPVPRERVLTYAREHDTPWAGYGVPEADVPLFLRDVPFEAGVPGGPDLVGFAPPVAGGGGYLPGLPIGGGGGGVFVPGTPGTPGVPVVTSPVPEPATWVSMILGFGIVGASMRRGSAARRRSRSAA